MENAAGRRNFQLSGQGSSSSNSPSPSWWGPNASSSSPWGPPSERPGDRGRHADRIQGLELDRLAIQHNSSTSADDDVDLLGVVVAVRSVPLPRLDDVVSEACVLGVEGSPGKPSLLDRVVTKAGGHVLDFA